MSLDPLPEGQLLNSQHLLDKVAENDFLDCVKLLIEKYGAKPGKHRVPTVIKPIYMTAAASTAEGVRYFLQHHDIDLHSLDIITVLLQHGGPVDKINDKIRNIDSPITAVPLAVDSGIAPRVLLQTESHAQAYLDHMRQN
ncbi:hypothetical protein DM02DRAFT_676530 [Periconia macrospinosa]|uniref:Uncharacterized protein n=1 Tax=Periconia macrospinosa TaxID=97972 RepID=A0A2V1D710_9PLEO|nr:hypothetical protein DM02DRAFT_676530 [Periconia macrospinosa]